MSRALGSRVVRLTLAMSRGAHDAARQACPARLSHTPPEGAILPASFGQQLNQNSINQPFR